MDLLSSPPPTPTSDDSSLDTFKSDDVLATMQEVQNFENGNPLLQLCINSIRFLCIDAINLAGSGHPGICMGMAPAIFTLFERHLSFCPSNPNWLNRDRFILSAGHGSMLLYSILHLYGYSSVTMNDICNFRRLHSSTPGHPECTMTPGVEVSTGPLGQGIANAVGFAIAEAHICALFSRPDAMIVDNFTFCVVGDGCLMEGISSEACSLAGHLKLGKLIVLYDDNHMSIDGSTDLAFTENVSARFEAYGWHMVHVENGNSDIEAIDAAILAAKQCTSKPSLIKITTKIGYGSPKLQNTPAAHGSPINMSETAATRKALNYPYEPFHIPDNVLQHFRRKVQTGKHLESCWEMNLASYKGLYPELYTRFSQDVIQGEWPLTLGAELYKAAKACEKSSMATRNFSGIMLNTVAPVSGLILGGSADTATSTMTHLACSKEFTPTIRVGRNIRFGVREHAMGGICNGIALCGYNLRPFCGTFLVFSDYMRASMRMASMSKARTIFIMTHDSIGIGEDGPSHQPVEQIVSLRAMPEHDVWRPADGMETAAAYAAMLERGAASTIVLTRQKVARVDGSDFEGARRGGYVVRKGDDGAILATGSEVTLAVTVAEKVENKYGVRLRVISMPCWEAFEREKEEYRRMVLGVEKRKRVSVEAGSVFGWEKWADYVVGVEGFGRSGKGDDVLKEMGISQEKLEDVVLRMLRGEPKW